MTKIVTVYHTDGAIGFLDNIQEFWMAQNDDGCYTMKLYDGSWWYTYVDVERVEVAE